ncbi:hypothetical protein BJV74DRAFT_816265 [Russula compacta]|nr:hypothetical protein BJV74DRAFT_816265 [Russula compacta]
MASSAWIVGVLWVTTAEASGLSRSCMNGLCSSSQPSGTLVASAKAASKATCMVSEDRLQEYGLVVGVQRTSTSNWPFKR